MKPSKVMRAFTVTLESGWAGVKVEGPGFLAWFSGPGASEHAIHWAQKALAPNVEWTLVIIP